VADAALGGQGGDGAERKPLLQAKLTLLCELEKGQKQADFGWERSVECKPSLGVLEFPRQPRQVRQEPAQLLANRDLRKWNHVRGRSSELLDFVQQQH
jgi:hypothetical protein